MIKFFAILFSVLLLSPAFGQVSGMKKKLLRVGYYNKMFGHIHRNASRYSSSLSTIVCGHPLKIYHFVPSKGNKRSGISVFNDLWYYVKAGPYEGYVRKDYISKKRVSCFQDHYPKFFDDLELEITDLYYWGKLYDQYLYGKSRVR